MRFVSRHEDIGSSSESAFEDPVVIIVGCDDVDLLRGLNHTSKGADSPDSSVGLPFAEAELLPQNPVELRKNERGEEQLHLPSPNVIKNLVRLATRENKSGDQNVGVQDDPHRIADYLRTAWTSRSTSSSVLIPRAWAWKAVFRWSFLQRRSSR